MLKDFVSANTRCWRRSAFMVVYALAVAFSFPAASVLTIFAGFLFGWLLGGACRASSARPSARRRCSSPRARPSAVPASERAGGCAAKLASGFEKNAFSYLLVLRIAPFIPFFVVNIAPALFDVRLGPSSPPR